MRGVAMGFAVAVFWASSAFAQGDADLVKRGEYLARAGDCIACHTGPGQPPYSGGYKMDTPIGVIYPPNLTPDKQTGIGDWSDDQFYRAMHEGIGKDGEYLYPVFPFPWYTNVTRQDALAIKAYLFSLPPTHRDYKPPAFPFPFNIREALLTWRTLFFKPGKPGEPAGDDKVARGKYLVDGLGHCGECHNHANILGASDWSGKFEGGEIDGWYAPNITSDGKQGVGSWSEDSIAEFLKNGSAEGHGVALGPMMETINDSLKYLNDDDLHAMAAYLKSIKPKQEFANNAGEYAHKGAPGEQAYLDHCSSCHGIEGKGVKGRIPALAENGAVLAQGPQDVMRVILGGLAPAHNYGPMPAVGASFSDRDVAEISNYVRNAFGNAAPTTSSTATVEKLRGETPTVMAPNKLTDCGEPTAPEVKAMAQNGDLTKLLEVKPVDRLQAIDDIVDKLKPAAAEDFDGALDDLVAGYCRAVVQKGDAKIADRAQKIGEFAVLAYSRATAHMTLGQAK
jgi:mono/diheme cytochrome c family protein